uniref:Something about silencing protein 10 n=1 Tax=Anthurium amnicola TaxID=1678845 RepID=A0A1D1ZA92_9ARAE
MGKGKGSNRQKKSLKISEFNGHRHPQQRGDSLGEEIMDDEIDAFHKQRDVIPIDINRDVGDASDEDDELPVLDFEDGDHDTDDSDGGSSGGGSDDNNDNDTISGHSKDYIKMVRQNKMLQQKYGGVEDDVYDDTEEEEEKKAFLGPRKHFLYGADNIDFEIQSDDDDLAEEEAIVVRSQKERAKTLSMEDFGLEDADKEGSGYDNQEKTLQDIPVGKDSIRKPHVFGTFEGDTLESYADITKDLDALSKEEQMNIVYSSAPELVGLLSELDEAITQLYRVKPLLCKAKATKGAVDHSETKHPLLLAYLQAISFYLLLKAEGHSVRDHPVIGRLVEIKNLLEKVKKMEDNISSQVAEIVNHNHRNDTKKSVAKENLAPEFELAVLRIPPEAFKASEVNEFNDFSTEDNSKPGNQKPQNGQMGQQSLEMLKVRSILEEKLKKKGILNCVTPKTGKVRNHATETVNRHLETLSDFDDDVTDGGLHGVNVKLHQFVPVKVTKQMFVSGDDDLPVRENIGEKRIKYDHMKVQKDEKQRKHELEDLAKMGAASIADVGLDNRAVGTRFTDADTQVDSGILESEDEFYKEVKRQRLTTLSARATLYTRAPAAPLAQETKADAKRQITYQMEKNKGLTRNRKKLTKIPRKKYKIKHQKAVVRRKGQVRDIRKPTGPYGGEASGINTRVSRSVRFNS